MDGTSPDSWARWVNAQEVNWVPWSECMTVPGSGWRFSIAIPNAEVTSPEVAELSIDQPTTRRPVHVQNDSAVHLALAGWDAL